MNTQSPVQPQTAELLSSSFVLHRALSSSYINVIPLAEGEDS